jgi:hypothetical protein
LEGGDLNGEAKGLKNLKGLEGWRAGNQEEKETSAIRETSS